MDGFRPEFCHDDSWPAPTLQQLAWEGATARSVRGVFPALTYPAHTTLVTGALPARHGVCHNRPFNPEHDSERWQWEAEAIRSPTLWDAVRRAGGTTASVSWPVTVGAAIDWNIPDIWPLDPHIDPMIPIREATNPPALFDEVQREAAGRLRGENFSINRLTREDRVGAIGAYLFERYRPTLMLIHLIGVDHVQHQLGLNNPMVRRSVGAADRAIGQILEVVERLDVRDRTAVVITCDHGEEDVHTELCPNVWLADAKLRERTRSAHNWSATFHSSGGSAFLRVRDGGDAMMKRARDAVEAVEPATRRLFRVVERQEMETLGADPESPFALAALRGVVFSDDAHPPAIRPTHGGSHDYYPESPLMDTGFVGAGAGFRRAAIAPILPLENIAPLIAQILGLEFAAPDGVIFPGLLTE